jgi:branched-subunit amino acid transport protein
VIPIIAVVTVVLFFYRFAGFAIKIPGGSVFGEQFLRLMPISVFAALVVSSLYKDSGSLSAKLLVLVITSGVARLTKQVGLSVVLGLIILWILVTPHS